MALVLASVLALKLALVLAWLPRGTGEASVLALVSPRVLA